MILPNTLPASFFSMVFENDGTNNFISENKRHSENDGTAYYEYSVTKEAKEYFLRVTPLGHNINGDIHFNPNFNSEGKLISITLFAEFTPIGNILGITSF